MPSGDASRSWFPAMLEELARRWQPSLSWEQCAELCRELTALRARIRADKGIGPVKKWCPHCKTYSQMEPAALTIRSLLFALRRIERITAEELERLDAEWKRQRRKHKLDACGVIPPSKAEPAHRCAQARIKAATNAVSQPRGFRRTRCPHAECPGWLKVIATDLARRPRRVQCTACFYCFEARVLRIYGIDIEEVY